MAFASGHLPPGTGSREGQGGRSIGSLRKIGGGWGRATSDYTKCYHDYKFERCVARSDSTAAVEYDMNRRCVPWMRYFVLRPWMTGIAVVGVFGSALVLGGAAQQPQTRRPSFYNDVLPILQQHCQACHRPGEIAPTSFVTYHETRKWAPAIAAVTRARQMPPWFADPKYGKFSNDPSLTAAEIETLSRWAAAGAP